MSTATTTFKASPPYEGNVIIPNGVLGMLIFIACEVMFFTALISAYLVVSAGVTIWPPADQPHLPLVGSSFNTLILMISGVLMFLSNRKFRLSGNLRDAGKLLAWSIACGVFFVAIQGFEWIRLMNYGLTMTSSAYGSFFYLIIGTHGLHALVAIALLIHQFIKLRRNQLLPTEYWTMQAFWYFVVVIWPFLFVTVYLT